MTHNHPLDYALAEAVLKRGDAGYLGMIGSQTKARRFRMRLEQRGYPAEAIASLHCPIGLAEVPGKRPLEVAISIAGQVIAHYHAACSGRRCATSRTSLRRCLPFVAKPDQSDNRNPFSRR
ncbi:hypothetical protein D3C76_982820 [compost metagenome]